MISTNYTYNTLTSRLVTRNSQRVIIRFFAKLGPMYVLSNLGVRAIKTFVSAVTGNCKFN